MVSKENLKSVIDNYLEDDGLDRDIVVLAKQMGIEIGYQYFNFSKNKSSNEDDFVAFIYIDDNRKVICINRKYVNNGDLSRFIVAYLIADYVTSDDIYFKSLYKIDEMKIESYIMAKRIFDRSNKYKKKKTKSKTLNFFKVK